MSDPTTTTQLPQRADELVAQVAQTVNDCACVEQGGQVLVLRSFDQGSRGRARQLRADLSAYDAITLVETPAATLDLEGEALAARHFCVWVDVTGTAAITAPRLPDDSPVLTLVPAPRAGG
ncbi:hypothetical protein [Nocardioides limicola]|uniref:hypothetical protein n=1 Tax=Nocardioides limicola TaxID=2803368 RepID=UPI00193B429A|nr:hypothetical protein [Nocardioides sp. DJM-14]